MEKLKKKLLITFMSNNSGNFKKNRKIGGKLLHIIIMLYAFLNKEFNAVQTKFLFCLENQKNCNLIETQKNKHGVLVLFAQGN